MDKQQQAALEQWNATRPAPRRPMADARQDYRVALVCARERYERAIARAAADRLEAERHARETYLTACKRKVAAERLRATLYALYQEGKDDDLVRAWRRYRDGLKRSYLMTKDNRYLAQANFDVISAVLAQRGVDVS